MTSGYAPVGELRLYDELHGSAGGPPPPLVLLHGGGDTIETSFGTVLPSLARTRQVIAYEQQGRGRTADIDRPFRFEDSADHAAIRRSCASSSPPPASFAATASCPSSSRG